jgi:hypothetical protein
MLMICSSLSSSHTAINLTNLCAWSKTALAVLKGAGVNQLKEGL